MSPTTIYSSVPFNSTQVVTAKFTALESLKAKILEHENGPANFTPEEEQMIAKLYKLMGEDDVLKGWRKYALKNFMMTGIRMCKMNPEFTITVMRRLYLRGIHAYYDFFGDIRPSDLAPVFDQRLFKFVKRPEDKGPLILVFYLRKWSPSTVSTEQLLLCAISYIMYLGVLSPEIQQKGLILVADATGLRFEHVRQLSISFLKKCLDMFTIIPPVCKGLVVCNTSPVFDCGYKLWKWVLPDYWNRMIFITRHAPKVNYFKRMEPHMLPQELGGTMPDEDAYYEGLEDKIMKDDRVLMDYATMVINVIVEYVNAFKKDN